MLEFTAIEELPKVLVLQVIDGDDRGDWTPARLELREGTEPQVELFSLDEIAQALGSRLGTAPARRSKTARGESDTCLDCRTQWARKATRTPPQPGQ